LAESFVRDCFGALVIINRVPPLWESYKGVQYGHCSHFLHRVKMMDLTTVLEQVRVGDSFYRESKPEILYERIGALIERGGLGWAKLEGAGQYYEWQIMPEQKNNEDVQATDWTIRKGNLKEYRPSAKKVRLKPLLTEKTRHAWTFYDQVESPR